MFFIKFRQVLNIIGVWHRRVLEFRHRIDTTRLSNPQTQVFACRIDAIYRACTIAVHRFRHHTTRVCPCLDEADHVGTML